ncbi:hepatitis A virus cellular receptor 1 homolog isoform X1 [Mastacembelus armatus]|uniref:hepatitis A virus cellular receptor 1 homolog isoform X1 n=1 Tax=Mastacembelus armatus TaxID=205130 RepID=UPI000E45E5DE|nr:hepatitis A virus cellular receptor 1 homolog isoform X1 [Mastacembelus armatus]
MHQWTMHRSSQSCNRKSCTDHIRESTRACDDVSLFLSCRSIYYCNVTFIMKVVLLLALLTVSGCGSRKVVGRTGQNVTLPCNYDVKANGNRSICWNRGDIPLNGCNNLLIATGSYKVTENNRVSSRYRLLGPVDEGDVSLTILNLTEEDAGRYGCRVDIPWWTDDKYHIDLVIDRGQMTSTEHLPTSSFSGITIEQKGSSVMTVARVGVVLGLIVLVTAGVVVIIMKRGRLLNKIPELNSVIQFNLQLHRQCSVMENVYQVDELDSRVTYTSVADLRPLTC